MGQMSFLPLFMRTFFSGMPQIFRYRHSLVFLWMVLLQSVAPNKKTIRGLSRLTPQMITEWRMRRLLTATYWSVHIIIFWFVDKIVSSLPKPDDNTLFVVTDGSHKDKTGKKNPLNQKGKFKVNGGWFFGIKFVVLMFYWNNFRIPVNFRIVKKKEADGYKTENELFREMLDEIKVRIPSWTELVVVCGDAGFASKDNLKKIASMNNIDQDQKWGYVFSLPRTWNLEDGQKLRDVVNHMTKKNYKRTWIPSISKNKRRKCFWLFSKKARLSHLGEVRIVLSKKGYNVGPKGVKIIVTNLVELTERCILSIYQKRWMIEVLFFELKSGVGLGDQQVTKNERRVENSIGIAILAYLVLFRFGVNQVQQDKHWSIFKSQNEMRMSVMHGQFERNYEKKFIKQKLAA